MTVAEVARRTLADAWQDNCLGLSAQLAFYFFLGLFPALLVLVTIVAYLPYDSLPELTIALGTVAPVEVVGLLQPQLDQLRASDTRGVVTFGVIAALWSCSAAMFSIIDAANRAYKIPVKRAWWRHQLLAIALTLVVAVFIIAALAFMIAGPVVAAWLARQLGFGYLFVVTWEVIRWPLMVLFAVLGIDLLYYFAPNTTMRWDWLTPGAAVAGALWIGSPLAFRVYNLHLRNFNAAYGAIAGVIVVLIWFYLSALALVIGAELNGVLQKGRTLPPGP